MLPNVVPAEELAKLDEPVRALYAQADDGTYILDVDVESHPRAKALKKALVSEREQVKQAKAALARLNPEGGETPPDGEPNDFTTRTRKFQEGMAERDALIASLQAEVRRSKITEAGTRAVLKHGASAKVLLPYLERQAELDDKGRVFVRDEDGQPLLRKGFTDTDQYMSLEDFVAGLRDDPEWGVAFPSKQASGSETQPSAHQPRKRVPLAKGHIEVVSGIRHWKSEA
jgi:hypothetical protein